MLDRIANVVPYVAFLVALFFVELQLFGVEDALLGVIFQSFARTMVESAGLSFINYLKHAALFLVMSLCSSLAGLHPVLLVAGSAVYMFCITLMNSDDYLPRNFFMLGLGFLLLEIYPISAHEIPMRMVATLFAVACTTAFIYAMRHFSAQSEITQDRGFVMRAFDDIGFQLIDLSNLDVSKLDAHRVYDITREYCNKEYGNVFRQGGVLSGRQRYTFSLLICAEQIADMMHGASRNVHSMEQAERDYLLDLSEVFLGFGQGRIKQVRAMISALQEFLDTHRLENIEHDTAWRATLEAMMYTLSDSKASRDNSTPFGLGIRYRLHFIKDNFSLKNSQLRFSIQLGVIIGTSFAVSELMLLYMDTHFGAWIPITSFLMMNTYRDETMRMMGKQLLGMLVGMAVFVAVTHFIPESVRIFCVLVMGYGVILMNFGPAVSMAAGTQLALAALYPTMSLGDTLMMRLVFVLLGTLVVLSIIFVFLQSRRSMTISHKMSEMERVDERLLAQIRIDIDHGQADSDRSIQLLYYLHMNASILGSLANKVGDTMADEVKRLIEANYQFAMDAAHAIVFLNSDIKKQRFAHLRGTTSKLRLKIDGLPLTKSDTE